MAHANKQPKNKLKLKRILLLLVFLTNAAAWAQQIVKVSNNYATENKEIQELIDFQNIYIERLNFVGEALKGKYYEINIREFKNGKPSPKVTLFDGSESDYFKISLESLSLKFFFSMTDGKLKTYIKGSGFGSKKSYFKLNNDSELYALKDFFGSNEFLEINIASETDIPIFAIITPTIHKDGSGSYCEVVQSDIKPENLGTHFKIPHYFLVSIRFK
ncbi:hypothetical protein E6C50_03715 [Flavobacterium supellecticarium]|uniref:Uncharacterized protein n=1 Tax=Flavobacterium supellecticarium TaxID=2565924 RepID=A0A4S4A4C1_9FLAO|nr:hypothetical protein E6C50_03715 [Flavobacterium supellecticarium]